MVSGPCLLKRDGCTLLGSLAKTALLLTNGLNTPAMPAIEIDRNRSKGPALVARISLCSLHGRHSTPFTVSAILFDTPYRARIDTMSNPDGSRRAYYDWTTPSVGDSFPPLPPPGLTAGFTSPTLYSSGLPRRRASNAGDDSGFLSSSAGAGSLFSRFGDVTPQPPPTDNLGASRSSNDVFKAPRPPVGRTISRRSSGIPATGLFTNTRTSSALNSSIGDSKIHLPPMNPPVYMYEPSEISSFLSSSTRGDNGASIDANASSAARSTVGTAGTGYGALARGPAPLRSAGDTQTRSAGSASTSKFDKAPVKVYESDRKCSLSVC